MQWACNVLGYHWLIKELQKNLLRADNAPAKVVNVASFYAGGLDLSDPEFKHRSYCPDSAYQASKQANRMMARAWSQRLPKEKVCVFSCHPGVATSNVSLGLGFDLDRSEKAKKEGAVTPLFLALDPKTSEHNGMYFRDSTPQRCPFSDDAESVERLFNLLESYQ